MPIETQIPSRKTNVFSDVGEAFACLVCSVCELGSIFILIINDVMVMDVAVDVHFWG